MRVLPRSMITGRGSGAPVPANVTAFRAAKNVSAHGIVPRLRVIDTRWFLDRQRVVNALEHGVRIALMRAGAFVRRSARSSIRKSQSYSLPYNPPRTRQGMLRKMIQYALEPWSTSVIIGPMADGRLPTIAHTLEYGGWEWKETKPIKVRANKNGDMYGPIAIKEGSGGREAVWIRIKTPRQMARAKRIAKQLNTARGGGRRAYYLPRPYMFPALLKGAADMKKKLPEDFALAFGRVGPSSGMRVGPTWATMPA